MPLNAHAEADRVVWPRDVLGDFSEYFNNKYGARVVYGDSFRVKRAPTPGDPGLSEMNLTVYVPGELTREDFEADLMAFQYEHPEVDCELRWRTSPEQARSWNEAHSAEISRGEKKPHLPQGMATNVRSSVRSRSWPTLLKWALEREPENPYPEASFEELEALEEKGDKKLKEYYRKMSEYDDHKGEVNTLLRAFREGTGREFDPSSKEDAEILEEIYEEVYEESLGREREWYEGMAKLTIPSGQFAPGVEGNVSIARMYRDSKVRDEPLEYVIFEGCLYDPSNWEIAYPSFGAGEEAEGPSIRKYTREATEEEREKINSLRRKNMPAKKHADGTETKPVKDSLERMFQLAQLLGEAHDKIMEAQDLAKEMVADEELDEAINWDLDDLEEAVSQFEFMGEDDPAGAILRRYTVPEQEY